MAFDGPSRLDLSDPENVRQARHELTRCATDIRLLARSGTTNPDITWLDIEAEGVVMASNGLPKCRPSQRAQAA